MTADPRVIQAALRRQLNYFVEHAFRYVHPRREFVREDYLEALCFALQSAAEADVSRLLVTMPPRMLKSFSASVCLPAFMLGRDPSLQIAVATYGEDLAREHMRLFRSIITSRWYKATFPAVVIPRDGNRWENVTTTLHGGLRVVTVGGSFTGLGADLLIVDDLIKAQDANSTAVREAAMNFYSNTALTRMNDQRKARAIVVQQRLHIDDIPSRLIERGGFTCLELPAAFSRNITLPLYDGFVLDYRAGDLLSPVRYPQETLDRLQREMGAAAYSAQFLQDPLPDASMIVDLARLHVVEEPFERANLRFVVTSVDTAVKIGEECDYSVISTFGYDDERWCLMNVVRARLDYPALKEALWQQRGAWRSDLTIIEDTHTGEALWREVGQRDGRTVTWRPKGDKAERLSVATGRLYAGDVVFPRSEIWFPVVMSEMRSFPARHDDIVDSISQFVGWLNSVKIERLIDRKEGRRPSNPARRLARG